MDTKKVFITSLVVFIFVFLFEMIFHGFMLRGLYMETASLWRPPEAMQSFFPLSSAVQILFSLFSVLFYKLLVKEYGVKSGLIFGSFLGLLFGISQFGLYAYMPIPMILAVAWFAGIFLESLIIGLIIGLMNKN
ncbi:MAG: hypothetical protein HRT47_12245 [Candidatus Caenarcaniphilales bacterium]|nr:hypothetical protein [Candidatus Caenarcaniphilales bacterium]